MLSDRAARVSYYSFLYALTYFKRDGDGLEGESRPHCWRWTASRACFAAGTLCLPARRWRSLGAPVWDPVTWVPQERRAPVA